MVFVTMKLFVFKSLGQFFLTLLFLFVLSNYYQALLWSGPISFLVKYRLIYLFSVLSDAILTSIINFKKNRQNFGCIWCLLFLFDFVVCLDLPFLIMDDLIVLRRPFLLHWFICFGGNLFVHTLFLKITWKKTEMFSVVHLVDIYAKNLDERGRNFMCKRTLPSLHVIL